MTSATFDAAEAEFRRALELHAARNLPAARDAAEAALRCAPRHVGALNLLGVIATQSGRPLAAVEFICRAIDIAPGNPSAHYNLGNAHFALEDFAAAVASYDAAIALQPDYPEAFYNRGNALRSRGDHAAAIASYNRAIALRPRLAVAYCNRGNAERSLGDDAAAMASYTRAIELQPTLAVAHRHRGHAWLALGHYAAALADFDQALALQPDSDPLDWARGNALYGLGRHGAAVACYDQALALQPDAAEVHNNRGNALLALQEFAAAAKSYARALELDPALPGAQGLRRYAQMQLCDWRDLDADLAALATRIAHGEAAAPPFCLLALTDAPALHRQLAALWMQRECPADHSLGRIQKRARRKRLRIGYFSADFYNHPVARLCAELIETHDRGKFEILGFSFGSAAEDAMRARLQRSFDHFFDVRADSPQHIARLARQQGIDIAVDLGGYTQQARPAIFALRAAPIQASYLGYLGTLAAPYMDYLIADATLIPAGAEAHYTEQIVYLPWYQANDSTRHAADRVFTRAERGLPPSGCVYCCFNANYKITPATFDAWMRILARVPGSVLWLYAGNRTAEGNLRREATVRGIDPTRLIFAPPLPYAEYLARYRAADLFLDTLPYNAGATASDALWMGVPVLTQTGQAFAARVGASLLEGVRLPELITTSEPAYVQTAIDLGLHPERLDQIKQRLAALRATAPLFDTPRFTQHLEAAYRHMAAHYRRRSSFGRGGRL